MSRNGWQVDIGLEIHVQLATASKIFSGSATTFGAEPNGQASLVDLAMPGTLPVLNQQAVAMAITFGLAVGAEIPPVSIFARKNYFYPDLPKGYQISQYEQPIVQGGRLRIRPDSGERWIDLTRAHLEEDAGKSMHDLLSDATAIDLNRAGVPLLEVVSEPQMHSAQEAVAYMKAMHQLVRFLGICDGNLQEGSFRCDANVSVRRVGQETLGTRCEIKNLNSFRFIEKAINYEIDRHIDCLEQGQSIIQQTRLYDADQDCTRPMRSKEEANDYRYFPDPDLLPVVIDEQDLQTMAAQMPPLPDQLRQQMTDHHGLSSDDAELLLNDPEHCQRYLKLVELLGGHYKLAANWLNGEITALLKRHESAQMPISLSQLAALLRQIGDKKLSHKGGRDVLNVWWQNPNQDLAAIIQQLGLDNLADEGQLIQWVDGVIAANAHQVQQYREGKTKLLGFFVGQVMKQSKGKADPATVSHLVKQRLGS